MKLFASIMATVAVVGAVTLASQQAPWGFSVQDAAGRTILSSSFMTMPYKPGLIPNVYADTGVNQGVVRDASGRVISGLAFYGWTEGATMRVAVLSRVSPEGSPNSYYPMPDEPTPANVRFQEIATYTITTDKPTPITELKALGLSPMALTVGVGVAPWTR